MNWTTEELNEILWNNDMTQIATPSCLLKDFLLLNKDSYKALYIGPPPREN